MIFLLAVLLAGAVPLFAQTATDLSEIKPWVELAEASLEKISDPKKSETIQGWLIAIQYRIGDQEEAIENLDSLVDEIEEIMEGESGHERVEKLWEVSRRVQELAYLQSSLGNDQVALNLLERCAGPFRLMGVSGVIRAAGSRGDLEAAKRIFEQFSDDPTMKVNPGDVMPSLSDTLIEVLVTLGDPAAALTTFKGKEGEVNWGMVSNNSQKLSIAEAFYHAGKKDEAESLVNEALEDLKEHGGLHYKAEYISAQMRMAQLHPNDLQQKVDDCVHTLETHVGVNGSGSGYFKLAHELAKLGEFEMAIEFTKKLDQEVHRGHVRERIAVLQAKDDNLIDATQTVDSIGPAVIKVSALTEIAKVLVEARKTEVAKRTIEEALAMAIAKIETSEGYDASQLRRSLKSLALLQTHIGEKQKALAWIETISDPYVRASVWLSMVRERLNRS